MTNGTLTFDFRPFALPQHRSSRWHLFVAAAGWRDRTTLPEATRDRLREVNSTCFTELNRPSVDDSKLGECGCLGSARTLAKPVTVGFGNWPKFNWKTTGFQRPKVPNKPTLEWNFIPDRNRS